MQVNTFLSDSHASLVKCAIKLYLMRCRVLKLIKSNNYIFDITMIKICMIKTEEFSYK